MKSAATCRIWSLTRPNSSSTIRSLSDLGVTFNDTGQMSFDTSTFNALSDTQISDAFKFLGSVQFRFRGPGQQLHPVERSRSAGSWRPRSAAMKPKIPTFGNQITTAQAQATQVQATATPASGSRRCISGRIAAATKRSGRLDPKRQLRVCTAGSERDTASRLAKVNEAPTPSDNWALPW